MQPSLSPGGNYHGKLGGGGGGGGEAKSSGNAGHLIATILETAVI